MFLASFSATAPWGRPCNSMWNFCSQAFVFLAICYFSFMGCARIGNSPSLLRSENEISWLPGDGEVSRGQQTFKDMGCYTCHAVPDPSMPPPISSRQRQVVLGETIRKAPDFKLAAAIVDPLHLTPEAQESKPVGDYADVLTVQQVTDLVAYLKAL